jgi:vacuolar protein sorting-associated protein 13A/C
MVYFSALSAPHAQHLTRVVDKVGGMEKFVPQSDIEGLPALKLNVSLDNPIIKMPKSSSSKE